MGSLEAQVRGIFVRPYAVIEKSMPRQHCRARACSNHGGYGQPQVKLEYLATFSPGDRVGACDPGVFLEVCHQTD